MKMSTKSTNKVVVVVPNWNGKDDLPACLDSLLGQSFKSHIIVVENGSMDGSLELLQTHYPQIELIVHGENKGYAGGVNPGFKRAIEIGASYVAPFNNDAIADKDWLKNLAEYLDAHPKVGTVDSMVLSADGDHLDSVGECYTTWGLPYPRGRNETDVNHYDNEPVVFAACGAACLYRVATLKEIGLLDEDFFAYYEDVDLSFRVQLAGWQIRYVPTAQVYHQINATGSKIKGFMTYQTMKNLPWLLYKNAPASVFWRVLPRFIVAYCSFILSAIWRGQGWPAIRGFCKMVLLLPKKTVQRRQIQHGRKVTSAYIWTAMTQGLPPNARKLRLLFHPIKARRSEV